MNARVMHIGTDAEAILLERPNRFLGMVDMITAESREITAVHVHDPGRLIDLLYAGNRVLLKKADNPRRKTAWDLIAARHDTEWILVHAGYHRSIVELLLQDERRCPFGTIIKYEPEVTVGHSRLDFRVEKADGTALWIEVKGCTFCEDGRALFPDAPTARGTRHLKTLIELKERGEDAALLFLIFRPEAKCFAANKRIDPVFFDVFNTAVKCGVEVHPLLFSFRENKVIFEQSLRLCSHSD